MRYVLLLALLGLTACAMTPEQQDRLRAAVAAGAAGGLAAQRQSVQQAPPPPPLPIYCTSVQTGNTVHTDCH